MLGGHRLDGVDVLAAGVEPVPDGALGVLVGQPGAHGQQHGGRGVVLAGDQLERISLVGKLFARRRGDARLDGFDDLQDVPVGGARGVGVLGARRGSRGDGGVCSHAIQPTSAASRRVCGFIGPGGVSRTNRTLGYAARSADGISGSSSSLPNRSVRLTSAGPVVQPAPQQPVALDVGAGVGPPQRRRQEAQRSAGPVRR